MLGILTPTQRKRSFQRRTTFTKSRVKKLPFIVLGARHIVQGDLEKKADTPGRQTFKTKQKFWQQAKHTRLYRLAYCTLKRVTL